MASTALGHTRDWRSSWCRQSDGRGVGSAAAGLSASRKVRQRPRRAAACRAVRFGVRAGGIIHNNAQRVACAWDEPLMPSPHRFWRAGRFTRRRRYPIVALATLEYPGR
jgi:hypothetical protein